MSYKIFLPDDKHQKEVVLNRLIDEGEHSRAVEQINWWLAYHYLKGARDFDNVNYREGTLDVNYLDQDGVLRFRYDDIVAKYQAQIGRLLKVDLRPKVTKRSIGMEDLRKASIAQTALDAAFPKDRVNKLKMEILPPLLRYGTLGLMVWEKDEDIGVEIVLPWELVPIPSTVMEPGDVRGLARVRRVPMEWIQKLDSTPGPKAAVWDEMEKTTLPTGQVPSTTDQQLHTYTGTIDTPPPVPTSGKKKNQQDADVVTLSEVFMKDERGYLSEYIMMAGGKILSSNDYAASHARVCSPLQVMVDIPAGGFWGRSFVSTQLPLNQEIEYTTGRLLQNVQDIDTYGIQLIPTTTGTYPQTEIGQDGLKYLRYEPDYTAPNLKPEAITPFNAGTLPAEVLRTAIGLQDKIANQPTALMGGEAPGRVDSKAGLGLLYDISNTALSPTALHLATAMINCYKAMLSIMSVTWTDKLVEVTMLDDSLAGIKLNPQDGTLALEENPLPHPDEIKIDVAAMLPQSAEQEKMEIERALEIGAIDMFEYRTEVRKRGLSLPVGNEAEWQNYRRAMMENLLLFSDGREPGEVIVDDNDMHEIHLRVLQGFMARPEFFLAATQVREAFKKHYDSHIEKLGNRMPEQAPYPEDAAQQQMMAQQMAGQQPGGGGLGGQPTVR